MEFKLLAAEPVPVWVAAIDADTYRQHPPVTGGALRESFDVVKRSIDFRGVSFGRLPTILATGIDVEPTTAPIFVSDFNKAWEYGGLAESHHGPRWEAPGLHVSPDHIGHFGR